MLHKCKPNVSCCCGSHCRLSDEFILSLNQPKTAFPLQYGCANNGQKNKQKPNRERKKHERKINHDYIALSASKLSHYYKSSLMIILRPFNCSTLITTNNRRTKKKSAARHSRCTARPYCAFGQIELYWDDFILLFANDVALAIFGHFVCGMWACWGILFLQFKWINVAILKIDDGVFDCCFAFSFCNPVLI